MFRETFEMIN